MQASGANTLYALAYGDGKDTTKRTEVANVKTETLIEQILSSENLNEAFLQVKRNKGAEGIDGMKVNELNEHLKLNGDKIKEQIRERKYKPQAVRRVEIPKADGGIRNLGVPTVTDRFIQQAIAQVLGPIYEKQFHDNSYEAILHRNNLSAIDTALEIGRMLDFENLEGKERGAKIKEIKQMLPEEYGSYSCIDVKELKGKRPIRIFWAVVNKDNVDEIRRKL